MGSAHSRRSMLGTPQALSRTCLEHLDRPSGRTVDRASFDPSPSLARLAGAARQSRAEALSWSVAHPAKRRDGWCAGLSMSPRGSASATDAPKHGIAAPRRRSSCSTQWDDKGAELSNSTEAHSSILRLHLDSPSFSTSSQSRSSALGSEQRCLTPPNGEGRWDELKVRMATIG